ncbi:ABC transporter substrate-binding protein [Erythrobacter arachoides]|uniref:ABC transporter substrate-binding protein n=1 Tax=Aurantiacibacter arachoides TaxID=1850444 RepID=A0A845A479_9SPHN|nr:ABC transporter substrate-binding protein [Aurantiacibacter arachoides]MXO94504.1 ABC transporter substrate-binding protein [Aurantiacibacter arachoides]GGD62925.1 hypothetical protein GCM10011411_24020 [Aurantiacibacter arachoides]
MIVRRALASLPAVACLGIAALLAGCGAQSDGTVEVAVIGNEAEVFADGVRLSPGGQLARSAVDSGLVAFDAAGEVVPALAERWIVTDDGLSFIFRLREGTWPDGSEITAVTAREALESAMRDLDGTSLGRDLSAVAEVRAMAGRVIEIRLAHPEPYLLQLLAQPELALRPQGDDSESGGTGPMTLAREENGVARYAYKPPSARGLPFDEDWQDGVQDLDLRVTDARQAIAMFDQGAVDVVLGGTLGDLPLVETGPLSSGTLRIDSTFGLFGMLVRRDAGLLANTGVREGLAMAIDRAEVIEQFNIGGWTATTRPVSPGLPGDPGLVAERWEGQIIADRRAEAAARVAAWRRQFDPGDLTQPARLTLYLDEGPGWDLLLANLAGQLRIVGVDLVRAPSRDEADMVLIDRVARFPAPRWFLGQFACPLRVGLCSETVDTMVADAVTQPDPVIRASLMAQAEAELTLANVFIPIGSPLRWSLVRGRVGGFTPNPYAFHPLPPLAEIAR